MQLIIVPAAGSMGFEYSGWKKHLNNEIKTDIIVYPGHGIRISEGFVETWEAFVEDTYKNVLSIIKDEKYILFGHSMGGIVLYDVYLRMVERGVMLPTTICFAGCEPPMLIGKSIKANLPEELFRKYFIDMGGINLEVLQCEELAELLFATLRGDTRLLESYKYIRHFVFTSNVIVMNGKRDKIDNQRALWEQATRSDLKYYEFAGGHFFVFEQMEEVIHNLLANDTSPEFSTMRKKQRELVQA